MTIWRSDERLPDTSKRGPTDIGRGSMGKRKTFTSEFKRREVKSMETSENFPPI
jgi:hypothetical protein